MYVFDLILFASLCELYLLTVPFCLTNLKIQTEKKPQLLTLLAKKTSQTSIRTHNERNEGKGSQNNKEYDELFPSDVKLLPSLSP